MARSIFDLKQIPPLADLTAVTAATETAMYTAATYATVYGNDIGQGTGAAAIYRLRASGILSTPATAGRTLTITPRFGTTTGGISFGASPAQVMPVSLTNVPWTLDFEFVARVVGNGANSTLDGEGSMIFQGTAATAGNAGVICFGGTIITTANVTADSAIFLGVTWSVADCSLTPKNVYLQRIN